VWGNDSRVKYFLQDDFRASDGWLDKFKRRFGIRLITITGENLSCDVSAVDPFVRIFQEKVEELGLGPEQVYNADEMINSETSVLCSTI
jgi:hypothetical protein